MSIPVLTDMVAMIPTTVESSVVALMRELSNMKVRDGVDNLTFI